MTITIDVQKIAGGQLPAQGRVFIGLFGETEPADNPITVYSDIDLVTAVDTTAGVLLDQDGYPTVDGARVSLYVGQNFSFQIRDSRNAKFFPTAVQFKDATGTFDSSSLTNYNADAGIQLTASSGNNINMVTSGGGSFTINGSTSFGFDPSVAQVITAEWGFQIDGTTTTIHWIGDNSPLSGGMNYFSTFITPTLRQHSLNVVETATTSGSNAGITVSANDASGSLVSMSNGNDSILISDDGEGVAKLSISADDLRVEASTVSTNASMDFYNDADAVSGSISASSTGLDLTESTNSHALKITSSGFSLLDSLQDVGLEIDDVSGIDLGGPIPVAVFANSNDLFLNATGVGTVKIESQEVQVSAASADSKLTFIDNLGASAGSIEGNPGNLNIITVGLQINGTQGFTGTVASPTSITVVNGIVTAVS